MLTHSVTVVKWFYLEAEKKEVLAVETEERFLHYASRRVRSEANAMQKTRSLRSE